MVSFKDAIKKCWEAMDGIPNCPTCKGTGEHVSGWSEHVFWKGRLEEVCGQCKGVGKV